MRVVVLVLVLHSATVISAITPCESIAGGETACSAAKCAYCCSSRKCFSTPELAMAAGCTNFVQGLSCESSSKIAKFATCPLITDEASCIKGGCAFCCTTGKCYGAEKEATDANCPNFASGMTCLEARHVKDKLVDEALEKKWDHWKWVAASCVGIGLILIAIVVCCVCFSKKTQQAAPTVSREFKPPPPNREYTPLLAQPTGSINHPQNQPPSQQQAHQQPPLHQQPPMQQQFDMGPRNGQQQQPPLEMHHMPPQQSMQPPHTMQSQPVSGEFQQMPMAQPSPQPNRQPISFEHPHTTADVKPPPAYEPYAVDDANFGRPSSDSFYRQPPYNVQPGQLPARDPSHRNSAPQAGGTRGSNRPGLMKKFPVLGCDQKRS